MDDEELFEHEHDLDADDETAPGAGGILVACPYCGESVEIYLDPESQGEMVQDCEVCCQPWQLTVSWTRDGRPIVRVEAS